MFKSRTLAGRRWRAFWLLMLVLLEGLAVAVWLLTGSPTQLAIANINLLGTAALIAWWPRAVDVFTYMAMRRLEKRC